MSYHDFTDYLAESAGLSAEFLVSIPSESAACEDVTRVSTVIKKSNLNILLTVPQIQGHPFSTLSHDLQGKVSLFDPMAAMNNKILRRMIT